MKLNDDSYERQPGSTVGACALLYEGNSCVSVHGDIQARQLKHSIYSLGDLQGFRAINIQLCRKAQLTEYIEGGKDFVPE